MHSDYAMVLAVIVGLAIWALAGYAIWKWGPGLRKCSVRCPEKSVRATVLADQREAEFGCLTVIDVKACTLAPNAPLRCGKECMARL
jgi:hypothetical protein